MKLGWLQPISLSQIEPYGEYVIFDISHSVEEKWEITLKLNREPAYIDKIFRKLCEMK